MTTTKETHYPILEAAMDAVVDLVRRHSHKISAWHELDQIDPAEVSAIARDLGMSPCQLRAYASADPKLPQRLQEMLSALGITMNDYGAADNTLTRDMPLVCRSCDENKRCRNELAAGTAKQNFHEFCPNASSLDEMAAKHQ